MIKYCLLSMFCILESSILVAMEDRKYDRFERKNRYIPVSSYEDRDKRPHQERYKKVFFVSECLINQNIRAQGVRNIEGEGAVAVIMEKLLAIGAGITVVPCPELPYEGLTRSACGRQRYENEAYRTLCKKAADDVIKKLIDYKKNGFLVGGFIGVNGSPSCAVDYCFGGYCSGKCNQSGIFIEELKKKLEEHNLSVNLIGYDKWHKEDCLRKIEEAL